MPTWFTASFIILTGGLLLRLLTRRIDPSPTLQRVLLSSYALRVLLTLTLFYVSFWQLPLLRSLQTHPGFWAFGLDCPVYHTFGTKILEAWNQRTELPNPGLGMEYFFFIAGVYKVFGCHPLFAALLNSWLSAGVGLLTYLIGRKFMDRPGALTATGLVSFWPSSLIWPTQLLKDTLAWFLVFGAILLVCELTAQERRRPLPALRWLLRSMLLGIIVILATRLRFYLGSSLSLASMVIFGPAAASAWLRRLGRTGARYASIPLVIVTSTLFARTVDPFQLLSPRHLDRGYFNLAIQSWRKGNLQTASEAFRKAIQHNPDLKEAHVGLAVVQDHLDAQQQRPAVNTEFLAQKKAKPRRWSSSKLQPIKVTKQVPQLPSGGAAQPVPVAFAATTPQPNCVEPGRSKSGEPEITSHCLGARLPAVRDQGIPFNLLHEEDRLAMANVRFSLGATPLERQRTTDRVGQPHRAPGWLTQTSAEFNDEALSSLREMAPAFLDTKRRGFIASGGHSLMDGWAYISSTQKLMAYLPRALTIGFLAPFPWQWFDISGSTGIMRALSGIEMGLIYLLLPGIVIGVWEIAKRRCLGGVFMVVFITVLAATMSLVVANLGTIFRLRLQFLLPLLIVAAAGHPIVIYRRLFGIKGSPRARFVVER